MRKIFGYGGVAASIVLLAFGVGAIVVGVNGRNEVQSDIQREAIVGSPDMTPTAIKTEAAQSGLDVSKIDIPSMSVADEPITTGEEAKAFAGYMRIHTLESTGGLTYAQMGRYLAKPNAPKNLTDGRGGTNDETWAVVDTATNQSKANPARDLWVTETALTTALNTSFFAQQVALFSIVMGVAMVLTGIGFLVLTLAGALGTVPVPKRGTPLDTAPNAT
jgi:hypothetical protein